MVKTLNNIQKLKQQYKETMRKLDDLRQAKRKLIQQKRGFNIDQATFEKEYFQIVASEKKLLTEIYNLDINIKVAELKQLFQQNKFTTAFWRPETHALPLTPSRGQPFILKRKVKAPCGHDIDLIGYALELEEPHRSFYLDRYWRAFNEPRYETYGTQELLIICPKCQQRHVLVLEMRPIPKEPSNNE